MDELHWRDVVSIGRSVSPDNGTDQYDGLPALVEQATRAESVYDVAGTLFFGLVQGTWFHDERAAGRHVAVEVLRRKGTDLDPDAPELRALADAVARGDASALTVAASLRDFAERGKSHDDDT